ncbi:NADAR family protein [Pseudoxanthomonas sp.]|uniref:NADAR family protein n=1 Tax=Pseudoxanthomonas sp. TaxID=1871049 RepID=UPI0025DF0A9F|nr:NADAR family protein [Pseudoxanthomonas sp.]
MEASKDIVYFYTRTMPFWGLSNFSPPGFEADGVYWPTVEHYFQAKKFLDSATRERIRRAATPKLARELGQSRATPLRPGWDDLRDQVMLEALRLKFQQPAARDVLLSTDDRLLVEASPYDYYWAAGEDGSGLNRLGHLLMQVRTEIRSAA